MRQRILYWFRSPPNVKVGRPALDEEAIRWIEEHNPEIEFDWPKILEAQPPPPLAPAEDGRNRRGRRDSREPRRSRRSSLGVSTQPQPQPPRAAADGAREAVDRRPELGAAPVEAPEPLASPDPEEQPSATLTPLEAVVGHEQLARFRTRFAELQARITERGGAPARIEALRAQAEALNPDVWVTEAEAQQGLAEFEAKIRELRNALGLRRRRRSRRGGRRRHGASGPDGPAGLGAPGAPEVGPDEAGGPDEPDE